jgi:hypothetical protein
MGWREERDQERDAGIQSVRVWTWGGGIVLGTVVGWAGLIWGIALLAV